MERRPCWSSILYFHMWPGPLIGIDYTNDSLLQTISIDYSQYESLQTSPIGQYTLLQENHTISSVIPGHTTFFGVFLKKKIYSCHYLAVIAKATVLSTPIITL